MQKTRIHIIQFLGVLVLLCGYLLGNQPDNKSVMHFNSDPTRPTVISKAVKYTVNEESAQMGASSEESAQIITLSDHHHKHKVKVSRHHSFEIILLPSNEYTFHPLYELVHLSPIQESYKYLFFKEINPPPPKAC